MAQRSRKKGRTDSTLAKRADPEILSALRHAVVAASTGLANVEERRMFGCDGFFAAGRIYALVWKEGRIGLKLVDRDSYEEAMIMKGSDPWTAGTRTMSNWVLLPGGFESDPSELETWVERAYAQAIRDEDS